MYLRPKTKRRLVILGSAFSLIVGVLVIGYVVRARRLGAQIGHAREQAMTSYAAGDHAAALESFRFYLDETKTADKGSEEADAEAVLAYAKSRVAVEAEKGRHLYETVKILERYLRLRPDDAEARRMLLELQPRIGYNDEALQLADAALAQNPNDVDALWSRVRAYRNKAAQDRQFFAQALTAAEQLTKVAPLDLKAQGETLRLMLAARRSDAEVVARAESLRAAHAGDPRFDLLLATAHLLTRQPEPAATWLKSAAGAEALPDAEFALELSRHLEMFAMYPLAQEVIERGAAKYMHDAVLHRSCAVLLWQQGRHDEVVRRFAAVDPAKGDATTAAICAMSLEATNRRAEAAAVAEALARRKGDGVAEAWAITLKARFGETPDAALAPLAAQYRAAAGRDPRNAVAQFLLGQTYARMGEVELAADAWESAARLAPSWSGPAAMLARAALDAGRYPDAVRAAEAAYRRAPRDLGVAADWVVASYGMLQTSPNGATAGAESRAALLVNAEAIQRDLPGEPRTLPIYVALLAETGRREEAIKVARAALATKDARADLVTRLAVVSRTHGLALEAELAAKASAAGPQSPRAALQTAALLLQSGDAPKGLESFDATRAKASDNSAATWDVARLEFRDLAGDATTAADWAKLADAHAKDLAVQSAVLRSPARAKDRALWQRCVSRVKDLTGADGHLWQIEQARLALAGDAKGDELSGAIALLEGVTKSAPTSAEPRRLLALAYERRGRERTGDDRRAALTRAAEEIRRAADLRPSDPTIARDLVSILQTAGLGEQAVQHLDRFVSDGGAKNDPATRRWVAEAYASLGRTDQAAALLDGATDAAGVARLAAIRRQQGDPEEAADLYRVLLTSPGADAAMLVEAAEFFVDRRDPDAAQQFITKLTSLSLKPGALEVLRGRFSERRGLAKEAEAAYRAATATAGSGAAAWQELSGYLLRLRRYADAIAAADEGLRAAPGDEWLTALKLRTAELAAFPADGANDPTMAPLIAALSIDPSSRPAVETLALRGQSPAASPDSVRAAADRYPEFLPLQYWAVQVALRAGQIDRAEQVARRAARTRPDDAEAARLVAVSLAAQRDWTNAKPAALAWRSLAWSNPLPADLLVAEAMIETGDAAGAIDRLKGYATGVARDDVTVNALYARALIAGGKPDDAAALLEARAKVQPAWRSAWLSLATSHRDVAAASQWIERLATNDPAGRQSLAGAWFAAAQRFGSDDAYRKAFDVISSGGTAADLDIAGQSLLALCAQAIGNLDTAVAAHRAVLIAVPESPEAKNNLAYALTLRGGSGDLQEAKRLASEAVQARPDNATFRDTLARVDAKAGDLDAAAAEFRVALQSEPFHLEARLGLADVLSQSDRREEGKAILGSLEKDLRLGRSLPPYLAEQLKRVQVALGGR